MTGGRDGAAPAVAVTVLVSTRRAPPVGLSTGRWLLSEPPLWPVTGAFAAAGASGFVALASATSFGGVESSVLTSAVLSRFAEVSLLDFFDVCAPPVAFTIPGGACRTDASVDAEVPDVVVSTAPDEKIHVG